MQTRAIPLERAWARVCREAGGRVKTNSYLRDLNLTRGHTTDERRLEVVVSGLPLHHGAQVAVDATLVSPVGRSGKAHAKTHWLDGAALARAARKKQEETYPELLHSRRCRLLVAGQEVGGRWNEEAYDFVLALAQHKAESSPAGLRGSAVHSWVRRWTSMLSKAAMDSLVHTLLYGHCGEAEMWNGSTPPLGKVLEEGGREVPVVSRMPGR